MTQRLEALRQSNPRHKLVLHRVAAGDSEGEADLTLAGDGMMGDTSIVPGLIVAKEARGSERVRVVRLDAYLDRRLATRIGFIKIDVEGFEYCVLQGMQGWFRDGIRPPIACEIMPRAAALLGRSPLDTFRLMEANGYVACSLRDFRPLPPNRILKLGIVFNVIFLPRAVASAN
jgi:FkbM family methyltransferase